MSVKLYLLFCSHCSFKKLTDGSDLANLVEVKTCKDCGGSRQFKCPHCGYLIRASKALQATQDESALHIQKLREEKKAEDEQRKKELRQIARQRRQSDDKGDKSDKSNTVL